MTVNIGQTYYFKEVENNSLEILFSPQRTGSYELVCCGMEQMEALFEYGRNEEIYQSSYNNNKHMLFIAKTLLYQQVYCVCIHINGTQSRQTILSLRIEPILEPTNSLFKYQWGLLNKNNGYDINILPLWKYIRKSNVKIGIADTGINYNHCNLKGFIYSDLAYNFVKNIKDDTENIESEHGTHTAGIVAAQPDNNVGICGVTENPNVISLKIFGKSEKSYKVSDAFVMAVHYAIKHKIKIINCSFCGAVFSQKEKKIMEEAKNILFVVAAGNNSCNFEYERMYPACYELENSIVVAAVDREGKIYTTSNYGKCVDVAAPGENIVGLYGKDSFIKSNGTSAAAPFVTGVCSLLLETKQDLKPKDLKKIVTSSENVTLVKGLEKSTKSGGIINAYKAYRYLMMNF